VAVTHVHAQVLAASLERLEGVAREGHVARLQPGDERGLAIRVAPPLEQTGQGERRARPPHDVIEGNGRRECGTVAVAPAGETRAQPRAEVEAGVAQAHRRVMPDRTPDG